MGYPVTHVIIDDGHGWGTAGKRAPDFDGDGRSDLRENLANSSVADKLSVLLQCEGVEAHMLCPESFDVSLDERCRRVRVYCRDRVAPGDRVLLVSLHADAFPDPAADGWTVIHYNRSRASAAVAGYLSEALERHLAFESPEDAEPVRVRSPRGENYQILRETPCAAVLVEMGFMTNPVDLARLKADRWRNAYALALAGALRDYFDDVSGG